MFINEREQKVMEPTKNVKEWEMGIQLNTIEINNLEGHQDGSVG